MVSSGYDASDADHKTLLLSLMMTACDLSDQGCKDTIEPQSNFQNVMNRLNETPVTLLH